MGAGSALVAFAVCARDGRGRVRLHAQGSAEQVYATGLAAERRGVAAELERRDRRHAERRLARRAAVPQRDAGQPATGSA